MALKDHKRWKKPVNIFDPKNLMRSQIRIRILFSLLLVVLLTGILSISIGLFIINNNIIREAKDTVKNSLSMIEQLYQDEMKKNFSELSFSAKDMTLKNAFSSRNNREIHLYLKRIQKHYGFDAVSLSHTTGKTIAMANKEIIERQNINTLPFLTNKSFDLNKGGYGTEIISSSFLKYEKNDLYKKSKIYVKKSKTRNNTSINNKSLIMWAAVPIYIHGRVRAILYSYNLLNNNTEIIDRFNQLAANDEVINNHTVSTTTIFLNGLRVTTNVKDNSGKRATGTWVSDEVYNTVIKKGKTWINDAFVVERWYLSGYSPIKNNNGKIIGILYTGLLKEKYNIILRETAYYFLFIMMITTIIAVLISILLSKTIGNPIKRLTQGASNMSDGKHEHIMTYPTDPSDIKYLTDTFNQMIDDILERDRKLSELTERKLLHSQKLASVGRLASGIAHEINNPLTGILTFSELLIEDLKGSESEKDLVVIRDEALRCREIVRGIFDFARDTKLELVEKNLNEVITSTMMILEKHINFQDIVIHKELDFNIPDFPMDFIQMKSVISNLAVNAADAMPTGGELTISTSYYALSKTVNLIVADTGQGIEEENLQKIFDPFYTTKEPSKGTGLGLSVTYGIIRRHGGTIEAISEPGIGTSFTVSFPIEQRNEKESGEKQ